MAGKRRICVVTGSRAEYGLLYWIVHDLSIDPDIDMRLIVTGMHLSPEFGLTEEVIRQDGFSIDDRVEMLVSSDTPVGTAKSVGLGVIGFADALMRQQPDLLLLLGDRFEIFAAAQAALFANVPIAHIAGGDTTEGAHDEAIRHSITKIAHVHFVTNAVAARRVRQMGENPSNVLVVGSPGIDYIHRLELSDRATLQRELDCTFLARNILVTFHPVTLELNETERGFGELLGALDGLGNNVGIFFTRPNADAGGRQISRMLDAWSAGRENVWVYTSLGQQRYLSLMSLVDAVVGNSSSGLYEAPSLRKPTVDIGDRQRGRLAAASVIRCAADREAIAESIQAAFQLDCSRVENPYGHGDSAARIVRALKELSNPADLLRKHFHMLPTPP